MASKPKQFAATLAVGWPRRHPVPSILVVSLELRERTARLLRWLYAQRRVVARVMSRWAVLVLGTVVFAILAQQLRRSGEFNFDAPVMAWFQERRHVSLTLLVRGITFFGDGILLACVSTAVGVFLWARRYLRAALYVWVVALGAVILNILFKTLFERERPDELLRLATTGGYSFPSGHSMAGAAIYLAIAIIIVARFPRLRLVALAGMTLLIGGIGLSRIYLHVHYPSDVLAGWALGFSWPLWVKPLLLGRDAMMDETKRRHIRLPRLHHVRPPVLREEDAEVLDREAPPREAQ